MFESTRGGTEKSHLGARAANTHNSMIDDHCRADLTRTVVCVDAC